jgi:hypothetical protein
VGAGCEPATADGEDGQRGDGDGVEEQAEADTDEGIGNALAEPGRKHIPDRVADGDRLAQGTRPAQVTPWPVLARMPSVTVTQLLLHDVL